VYELVNIGNFEVLNSKAIKQIVKSLKDQFCFEGALDYVFLLSKKDKVFLLNRDVEVLDYECLRIDALGMYFGKYYKDGFRLSIEGTQLIGDMCKCNVVEVNQRTKHDWFKGIDLDVEMEHGFIIIKSDDDYIGCAKVKNNVAFNSIPSARTLKVVNEELD
jgi:NOL1/NOP2/fmu family ribosome biogenesis protein